MDLGSGDGRIVLEAARMNPKVRGVGVEIDEELVRSSTAAAQEEGFADRVRFIHQNAFDADLKGATVIVMWLFPELMRMLRPKILAEARPGTRIVTRTWDLANWKADAMDTGTGSDVFLWTVPARAGGYWTWDLPLDGVKHSYSAVVDQCFQTLEGVVRVGNRRGLVEDVTLRGEEISFTVTMTMDGLGRTRHVFRGRVHGDTIAGTVSVQHHPHEKPYQLPWKAKRARTSAYFAPTGVEAK
jgi:hypothetical protein